MRVQVVNSAILQCLGCYRVLASDNSYIPIWSLSVKEFSLIKDHDYGKDGKRIDYSECFNCQKKRELREKVS